MINKSIPSYQFAPENASGMAREWSGIASALPRKLFTLLFCLLFVGIGNAWGTVLFHETFGAGGTKARAWDNSYSVKSGVTAVYSGVGNYTMTNLKQGKSSSGNGGSGASLIQTTTGTDAVFVVGPLNVSNYNTLVVTYKWKAGSIKGTYSTSLYYKTSSGGSFTEVSGTGNGATTYVTRTYNLPVAAQVSTLYLKVVFNTSNTQAYIDEFELTGTAAASGYSITYHCNDATSGCPSDASGQSALPNPLPSAPTKTGFTFGGWYTNSTLTTAAVAGATLSANADLYAKWTCNVTLNRNGATETINNVVEGTALDDIDGTGAQGGCSAWTFVGWSKTQRAAQNNTTPMTLATTVDGAGPYYAVYRHTESGGVNTASSDNLSSTSTSAQTVEAGKPITYTCSVSNSYSDPARIYKNNTFTVAGGTITEIVLTGVSDYAISNMTVNTGTLDTDGDDGTWTGSATSVVFTASTAQTRIAEISVTYSGGDTYYYSTTASCCTPLGSINGSFSLSNLSQSSGVLTATLPSASKNANATSYRFTLYNNSDVEITHTDVATGSGDVSTTFSSPNVTAGNTYKVSVTPLVSPQGSYCSTTGTESDKASITMHYTVTLAVNNAEYGSISPTSTLYVASGTSISASTNTLSVGATNITATYAEQTAQYTYGFTNWAWSPSGSTITANTTATANFSRSTRTYNVTTTGITHATASPAIPATVAYGGSISTTITAATGYVLPSTISVSGASSSWNQATGALSISSVTGDVSITITPTCAQPNITADPADASYYVGDSPEDLEVTATLASGTRTYLWKVSTDGGSVWSNAEGTNNEATYSGASLSTASVGTLKFKCIVGNSEGGCTVESGVATITVSNASYFPNGKTIFIQAESTSAWTGDGCVKAWFHTAGGSETAQSTYWLFDATGGDAGKKLFATVVPATGDLPYLDIQRFGNNCSDWWNKNGGCSYADANGSNTIRSTGKHDDSSEGDYIRWNGSGVTMNLMSSDAWLTPVASMTDQGSGIWSGTYEYTPSNTSTEYVIATNYNGNIGNTGSNNNATLSGMIVGSTYNVTATLDVTDHSLEMSKTFVKGTVHFDLQGHGLAISDLENVAAGSKISAPSAPSATGYTFGGWYKEPACTNAWTFASDVVNETMTLYAKWTANVYTITKTFSSVTNASLPASFTYTGSTTTALNSTFAVDATNFFLPSSIAVTMGGTPLTAGTDYTYNNSTGAFTFSAVITGDIVITASATAKLKSIAITTQPTTRKYLVGDLFSSTGAVVTATMGDGNTKAVSATWTPSSALSAGTGQTVTASYTENGINMTATTTVDVYSVTVNKVNMSGTAISNVSVTATCSGRTLSQSVGATNYKFNSWNVTAGGVTVSTNTITGAPTGDVTINAKFHDPITVAWKVGTAAASGSPTTEVKYGTKISALPSTPADNAVASCGANKFMGWTAAGKIEGTGHSAPADLFTTVGGAQNLTENTIYRAVFATQSGGGYEQVTSLAGIKEGSAYFAYYGSYSGYRWYGVNAINTVIAPVDVSEGVLTTSKTGDGAYTLQEFTLVAVDASAYEYYIKIGNKYVIGSTTNATDLSLSDDAYLWKFNSINGSNNNLEILHDAATDCWIKVGVGTATGGKFRSYTTTGQQVSLFQSTLTISDYITGCCTHLDDLNGEVNWSNPTTAVVSWDDIDHVDSWTVKYKTHAAGEWSTAGASSASAGTRSVTISSLTPCVDYDFQIIATPEEDYCDKDQTIEDDQTHAYSVDYSGCSNVTKTGGGTTACGSSNLVATFTASLPYELPSSVSVSIGNVAQTQGTDFTWVVSEGVGTLTIGSAKQTGNIVIDVDGNLLTCDVNPTIGTATLDGSGTFSLTSVSVSVTGCSTGSAVCDWTDYGFVWGTSANPTGNKTAIGSDGTATSWSGTLTGSFSTGVTYYYRAYGKNSKDGAEIVYGSDATFIPRSVTFNANGGSDVATKYVASGGTVSAPSAPTRSGYNFGGWYTDNGTWASPVNWSSTISANVTYYAKWNTVTYDITYEGLSGASNSNPEEYTIETPTITLVNPGTRTGWTFAGWTCGGEPITQIVVGSTGNKTITATWTINQYNIAVAEVDGVTITATPTGGSTLAEGANTDVDYNKTVTLAYSGLETGIYWVGWKVTNAGGDDVTASVVSENTLTVPAYAVTVTAVLGKMKAWCMPEFEITGDVHLTSVKDVYVNSTSTTGDLLTVSGTNTENVTRISIDYLDNNGDVVGTKSSSPLRLRAGDNSGYVESDITTGFSTGTYSGSFSVRFTPTAYGELDNYKLRLTIKKGSRVLKTIEHPMSGRALPEEFVIAVKQNDQWYALPNTILDNNRAITPLKITVNDATTPTAATYAPSTAVYKGYETGNSRYAAGTNVYGVRLTDPNNKWLQVSSSSGTNYVWVSGTGNATCQDWWLSSSDFSSYTLKVPSSGAGDKSFGINNLGNIGYFASDATNLCKEVFLLPITNKYTEIAATVSEWGQNSVVLAANPGASANKAQAHIDDGSPTEKQDITAINGVIGTAKNVKVPLGDIDLDVSEGNEGKLLYIDWYNGSTLLGTSCVTIPRIVAEDRTANKTNDTDKKVWNTEVHVLPGATLTIDGESFKTGVINSTVSVNELQVYPGATINVSTGTLAASTLRLRNGWTRAGDKKYDVARVYIADDAALTKGTASMDYNIYELADGQHFYPLAVPFPVAVSAIDYADSWLAGFSSYGMDGQYVIKEYNGARRAEKGPDQANNWTPLAEGATLSPGKGYIMAAVPVYGEAIIRIPLTFDNAWTADGELGTVSAVTKNVVSVTAYTGKATEGDKFANKGWNLLGVPFMSCYATGSDMTTGEGAASIIQGKFNFEDGTWDDDKVRYVSVPVHDFSEYIQTDITDDDTKLLPGWSFFVQIETSGNLTFLTADQAASSSLPIYAPKRGVKADMPTVKTGIILSDGEKSDKTTFLVSDKYSATEYEINADLEKMFGNGYTLATYSLSGATRLAYNAMSNADASNLIPIGYRAPADGEYTFSINPRYAQSGAFERVDLIDYETGIVTDLLQYSYTFSTGRTQNDSRFAINVVKQKETPTDIENIQGDNVQGTNVRKLLIDGKVYIIRGGQMYDATGKQVKGGAQ